MGKHTHKPILLLVFLYIYFKKADGQANCQCTAPTSCADGGATIIPRVINGAAVPLCVSPNRICCNILPNPPACGTPPNPLIAFPAFVPIAGQASYSEYPWMAVILGTDNRYISGGVLIDPTTVLTIAHKLTGFLPAGIKVRLGEYAMNLNTEPFPFLEILVTAIRTHPQYNGVNLVNDIAILKLASAVDYNANPHIRPVCLPAAGTLFNGQRCWVSGYGALSFTSGVLAQVLHEIDVPVIDGPTCQTRLQATRLGPQFILNQQAFMCAGGEGGKDACSGDGGSPLVCLSGTQWFLAGIVAWGIGCGVNTIPGVYTNIPNYIQWINDNRG